MINLLNGMKKNVWFKIVFAVVLFVAGIGNRAQATDESHVQIRTGKVHAGDSCNVVDDKFKNLPQEQWSLLNNVSVTNVISFEIRNDTNIYYHNRPFTCTLNVSIRYYSTRDQLTPSELNNINLVVKYDTTKGSFATNIDQYTFHNAYRVNVVVNSISSPELGTDPPAIFRIQNQILIKRYYPFSPKPLSAISANVNSAGGGEGGVAGRVTSVGAGNSLSVSWVPAEFTNFPGGFAIPEEYDVEWTYVDKNSQRATQIGTAPYSTLTDATVAEWMRHDNSRTTIAADACQIPLTYPEGFVLVRVRGVMYEAGTNLRLTGPWQYRDGDNKINCVQIGIYQSNLNWQATATFAEGGMRKDVITFFDGALKSRQTVTINNADNVAMVAETMYDKLGRPAMSVLPSPVIQGNSDGNTYDNQLKYYPGVNKNESGNPYSYLDISVAGANNCESLAQTLDPSNGAANYYSANNPYRHEINSPYYFITKNVPDAGHDNKYYPFSLTEYMPDNTGRIRRQSGVGYEFRIGGGHETRYYYGKPTPRSLYRLFGSEVGNASHYLKNMVVDPNGQTSVNYVNASGKTIATALAGKNPGSLDALPSMNAAGSQVRLNEVLIRAEDMQVEAGSLKMEATATFLAAVSGDFTLRYSVNPAALVTPHGSGLKVCNNCSYGLTMEVKDDCGNMVLPSSSNVIAAFSGNDIECYTNREPFTGDLELENLAAGQYTVTYRLQLSEAAINYQVDHYIATNTDLKKLRQFFMDELLKLDLQGCYDECTNCAEKLGALPDFMISIKAMIEALRAEKFADYPASVFDITQDPLKSEIEAWITATYNSLSANCTAISANCAPSPCESKLEQMKQDVRPGGQYALFTYNETTNTYALVNDGTNLLGLYNIDPGTDADHQAIYNISFTDASGIQKLARNLSLGEFIIAYMQHPEWADLFVKKHVEYCNYLFCINHASSSYGFDESLREYVKNGTDAQTKGLYSRSNYKLILDNNKDPFFAGSLGSTHLAAMSGDLLNASDVLGMTIKDASGPLPKKNILQLVDWLLYNSPKDPAATQQDYIDSWSLPVNADCRSLTQEWEAYRELYLRLKNRYVQMRKEDLYPDCRNCFIGPDPAQAVACEGATSGTGGGGTGNCPEIENVYKYEVVIPTTPPPPGGCEQYRWAQYIRLTTAFPHAVTVPVKVVYYTEGVPTHEVILEASFPAGSTSWKLGEYVNWTPGWDPTQDQCLDMQVTIDIIGAPVCSDGGGIGGSLSMLSSCPTDPRAEVYAGKTRIWAEYINYQGYQACQLNLPAPTAGNNLAAVRLQATTLLNDLSTAWLSKLRAVIAEETAYDDARGYLRRFTALLDPDEVTPNATLVSLVAALKIVAQKNIDYQTDLDKIFPASTLPAGVVASNGYNNFKQVFDAILNPVNPSFVQMGIGPELLDQPYPWNKRPVLANYNSGAINGSLCTKINAAYTHYQAVTGNSATIPGFAAYLRTQLGKDFLLTDAELQDLKTRCDNGCQWMENPLILPAIFSPNPGNGDVSWVDCNTVVGHKAAFDALYPSGTEYGQLELGSRLYRVSLANYINHQLGFALSYEDYNDFLTITCPTNPNAILYTRPISPALLPDENACTRNLLAGVFETSHQEYVRYIDIVRRETRNRYISACLANQTSVKLEADQWEYHYTLYYYDQSGNLVKTVPPEGVRLLTEAEIDQVEMFNSGTASCDGAGIPTTENATGTFNSFSTAMQTNAAQAMEMWLYSDDASADRKLRIVTPDSKYMYQAAISGNKLWVEVFSLVPGTDGSVGISSSISAVADISGMSALQNWSHLVVQSAGSLATGPLELFLDGRKLTNLDDGAAGTYPFDWEITSTGGTYTLPPVDVAVLKHLRLYNREITEAEALANYRNSCLAPVGALAQLSTAGGPLDGWGRFNIPAPGSASTTGPGSTTEFAAHFIVPDHQLPTVYAYNSLNQVVRQQSPDGGASEFWYDRLGRLIISQNAEQKEPTVVNAENPAGRYSYTVYDALGRFSEVGEKIGAGTVNEALVRQIPTLDAWMNNEGSKRQITVTAYDEAPVWVPASLLGSQRNLRKRVVATALVSSSPNTLNPAVNRKAASYYSYDISGNVDELVQENADQSVAEAAHINGATGLKHIKYEYDLISGKMNKVLYQDGKWDQFYYRYSYDAENRLTRAYSSRADQIFALGGWINEATYWYYLHGPLARTELGKYFVQGIDYAYTLQGWLKGVNSQQLDASKDMSRDGLSGSLMQSYARDVYGFSLGYFQGDYKAIDPGVNAFDVNYTPPASNVAGSGKSLFNGNISHATYALSQISGGNASGYTYKYDQLNRLTAMNRHTISGTSWSNSNIINDHNEEISYDANGNILTYNRSGDHTMSGSVSHWDMDQLKYLYYYYDLTGQLRQYDKTMALPGDVSRLTNQLAQVKDAVEAGSYAEDIDDQGTGNYKYDKIGNLISDEAEGIESISWTVYGKISTIRKVKGGVTTLITYSYDASGNRIHKQVQIGSDVVKTFYVRDAQGNVLGGYKKSAVEYSWEEQNLYGSSRLGLVKADLALSLSQPLANDQYNPNIDVLPNNVVGKRRYELGNHLGNVLAVISDQKLAVNNGSGNIDHYIAEVLSQNEYYPFGMGMVGRKYDVEGYRYGFNGKENDNEVKGEGNQQDYGLRIYDPRLGKFLSTDPLIAKFPDLTPYQYASNNPIKFIDIDGGEGGDPAEDLYKSRPKIDMNNAPGTSPKNAAGFPRDRKYFWQELAKSNPEYFSETNLSNINRGYSPFVDEVWVANFPQDAEFMYNRLIHHHINGENMATPIPEQLHWNRFSDLHAFMKNAARNLVTGKAINGTLNGMVNILSLANDISGIVRDDPMALANNMGAPRGNPENNIGRVVNMFPEQYPTTFLDSYGVIESVQLETTSLYNNLGNVLSSYTSARIVRLSLYSDYVWDQDQGKFIGVNLYAKQVSVIRYDSRGNVVSEVGKRTDLGTAVLSGQPSDADKKTLNETQY
ncbi:MAG: hypothetical protein DI535_14065 [Citrobacter freundii]|nr:MAG: hypothetical protein DI535_14065 [Citrobacter freundii]